MRSGFPASLALMVCLSTVESAPGIAQESLPQNASFRGEFNPDTALTLVYGRETWSDRLARRRNTFDSGQDFIEPLYDAAYVEDGVEKHVVIATLTPRPRSQYDCHACSPMLGGAVFRRKGDEWRIESTGLKIEPGHAWLDGKHDRLALVRIGRNRYGLLHEVHDVGQGYESMKASLIFGIDGVLASRLMVPDVEGAGPGVCGAPPQHLNVDILGAGAVAASPDSTVDNASSDSAGGFYGVVVEAQWNEARCEPVEGGDRARLSGRVCQRTSRYQYRDGTYVRTDVESDVCRELPVQLVDTRG